MKKYSNETFERVELKLDDACFEQCVFADCVMVYSGGLTRLSRCIYRDCNWRFEGNAARTLQFMQALDVSVIEATFRRSCPNGDINVM